MIRTVTVQSLKYDGRVHRSWQAQLIEHTQTCVTLSGSFAEDVVHPHLGKIKQGTLSTEYYWTDQWYSVFRFEYPNGHLRNYYCNINQPIQFADNVLSFVDLDVDLVVEPDGTVKVLDEDEFKLHSQLFHYPPSVHRNVNEAMQLLTEMIGNRTFPFDTLATP